MAVPHAAASARNGPDWSYCLLRSCRVFSHRTPGNDESVDTLADAIGILLIVMIVGGPTARLLGGEVREGRVDAKFRTSSVRD